jgi:hypothetical protein
MVLRRLCKGNSEIDIDEADDRFHPGTVNTLW